jgi:hypothetical protein
VPYLQSPGAELMPPLAQLWGQHFGRLRPFARIRDELVKPLQEEGLYFSITPNQRQEEIEMETRQQPVTLAELAALMTILSYEEFEQFLKAQDPQWVEALYTQVEEDPYLFAKAA